MYFKNNGIILNYLDIFVNMHELNFFSNILKSQNHYLSLLILCDFVKHVDTVMHAHHLLSSKLGKCFFLQQTLILQRFQLTLYKLPVYVFLL